MAKKINIEVPVNFDGIALILDKSSYLAVDDYIKRGQMPLCVEYVPVSNSDLFGGKDVYPDEFNGTLTFVRRENEISVSAHGLYIWSWEGPEDFPLPAKLLIKSVYDKNVTSHYFNKEEESVDSGTVIEVPTPKAPAKKA